MTETNAPAPAVPAAPAKGPAQEVVVTGRPFVPTAQAEKPLPTKPFRLKAGAKHFGVEDGAVVELNARQAEAFADKFEPADAKPVSPEDAAKAAAAIKVAPTPGPAVRQDVGANTPITKTAAAAAFDPNAKPSVSTPATPAPSVVPSSLTAKETPSATPPKSELKTTEKTDKT
jgi:hypothetical protein